jgi:hypothetical protein
MRKYEPNAGRLILEDAIETAEPSDLRFWIGTALEEARFPDAFILGLADDGYIWGLWLGNQIFDSWSSTGGISGAQIKTATIQWLRCFNGAAELRVWRRGNALCQMKSKESPDADPSSLVFEESYPLVGSHLESKDRWTIPIPVDAEKGFTLMRGRAGEMHAPPVIWKGDGNCPFLRIRHYYELGEGHTFEYRDSRYTGVVLNSKGDSR